MFVGAHQHGHKACGSGLRSGGGRGTLSCTSLLLSPPSSSRRLLFFLLLLTEQVVVLCSASWWLKCHFLGERWAVAVDVLLLILISLKVLLAMLLVGSVALVLERGAVSVWKIAKIKGNFVSSGHVDRDFLVVVTVASVFLLDGPPFPRFPCATFLELFLQSRHLLLILQELGLQFERSSLLSLQLGLYHHFLLPILMRWLLRSLLLMKLFMPISIISSSRRCGGDCWLSSVSSLRSSRRVLIGNPGGRSRGH